MTILLTIVFIIVVAVITLAQENKAEKADRAENKSGSADYVYERNEKEGTIGGTNLDRFFIECVLSECNDFTKEKNIIRAQLLADKYNIPYPNGIESVYNRAMESHKRITGSIADKKLNKKREEEKEVFEQLNRYSDLYGKNKKIAMLTDRMNELRKLADSVERGADTFLKSTQQQERNWALWGGIADGIAGPGAGVSTALELQAQNAQIRVQNEANMRVAMPVYMSASKSVSQNRKNADEISRQIARMQEKLISDIPAPEVMKLLDIVNVTVDVSKTGAFKVTATVKTKDPIYIFEDVLAVVDGTLIAHVYDESGEIGTAKMVLPVNGVEDKAGIVGVGLSGAQAGKNYTVAFTPYKLWIMEK